MDTYWLMIWKRFYSYRLGRLALWVIAIFCLVSIFAPFLASSKPLILQYEGSWYFPLFRYLFYVGFYTKPLDLFFNLMILTFPVALGICFIFRHRLKKAVYLLLLLLAIHISCFALLLLFPMQDPSFDRNLKLKKNEYLNTNPLPNWNKYLQFMTPYEKLNSILQSINEEEETKKLSRYVSSSSMLPTLWNEHRQFIQEETDRLKDEMKNLKLSQELQRENEAILKYLEDNQTWIEEQKKKISYLLWPLITRFHWEEDAGGSQSLNRKLSIWDMTRLNRKSFTAALLFGVRISLVVGGLSILLSMAIGIPIGALAGYYGGRFDIITSRLIEIWETMPIFFMLLMVIAMLQSKSIFLIIGIIGLFGWTSFSRYIRGEFFKQRHLPYVEACRSIGFSDRRIIFSHILPNALPPILTLIPFAVMGAITSEAGLSFLGLGEEGSCSWGVLMDEGRSSFPSESDLLWPPAMLLTLLLVSIAVVGDTLRDALDPKGS